MKKKEGVILISTVLLLLYFLTIGTLLYMLMEGRNKVIAEQLKGRKRKEEKHLGDLICERERETKYWKEEVGKEVWRYGKNRKITENGYIGYKVRKRDRNKLSFPITLGDFNGYTYLNIEVQYIKEVYTGKEEGLRVRLIFDKKLRLKKIDREIKLLNESDGTLRMEVDGED